MCINPTVASIANPNITDIANNHGYPYILNIGLVYMDEYHVINTTAILGGYYDSTIISIANQIKTLNAPVYLRPGFEFGVNNSGAHEGMTGQQFINIWLYIYNKFQEQGVTNVAWIWNTVNPWMFNYMEFYPGDQYVDWWGINYFTIDQINNSDIFISSATIHKKPVMICESCPIENNGTDNSNNWQNWFIPYFNKIVQYNNIIKGFIYISDPWDKSGFWEEWPNTLININTPQSIRDGYAQEIGKPKYIHMHEYLQNPSIITGTVEPATKILVSAIPETITADGISISTITAKVCDSNNNLVLNSTATITFSLNGTGTLIGNNPCQCINGIAKILYKVSIETGTAIITANSEGLSEGTVTIKVNPMIPILFITNNILDFGILYPRKYEDLSLSFNILNIGTGTLSGVLTTDKNWIKFSPKVFTGNFITVTVTIDEIALEKPYGGYFGEITINSNGGTAIVTVKLVITCVLTKPNPYNPDKGLLTFFGNGIIPGKTTIQIYTLSGELVKILHSYPNLIQSEKENEAKITWDGKNLTDDYVISGIYLYTYESPIEKGTGKFTVIR